ncbi:hypothetical protein [Prevotella denticola]|uniref:hypothetical protein n=1 Tax=Prevotella denticola TaxID=28129 RepID=UPI001BAB6F1F|nr:hypothetical protein [Prevotella denticola]QUB89968.1 hypothetical protein J4855_06750 [Prevotella denticola]
MKKLVLLLFTLICSLSTMAQKLEQGSFAVLNGVKLVNTEMEFVSIHGMSEADFSEYEKDWKEDKPQIVDFFITRANIPLEGLVILGSFPKAAYTLKVTVNAISEKGNYDCDVTLQDAGRSVLARLSGVCAKGGTWGTKLNLIKDGARHTGKKLGETLRAEIKKAK